MLYVLFLFVPFWAGPERLFKEAKWCEDYLYMDDAITYYKRILARYPDYKKRDSVYLRLIEVYRKTGRDSLFCETVQSFYREMRKKSPLVAYSLYRFAKHIEEDTLLLSAHPDTVEKIFRKISSEFKGSEWADSAEAGIKYLNQVISLPVGKVYRCEVCGKVIKADRILRVKRKYTYKYREKYHTKEIRKGRCYQHQLVKVPIRQIIVCPNCGRRMGSRVVYREYMRCDLKKVERVEKINSDTMCRYCQITEVKKTPMFEYIATNDTPEDALLMLQHYRPTGQWNILNNIDIYFYTMRMSMQQYGIGGWNCKRKRFKKGIYTVTFKWVVYHKDGSSTDHEAVWEIDINERQVTALNHDAEIFMH